MSAAGEQAIRTRIWREEAEPDNPFAARAAFCHGYDVFGEMLGRAGWADMVYLLLRGEAPSAAQAAMLETLAVALANPGPRDAAVHAAMCGGVGGSTAAACLIAALAVGAGQLAGGREVFLAMHAWQDCGMDAAAWRRYIANPPESLASIWPPAGHVPGFDPNGTGTPAPVMQTLAHLGAHPDALRLRWLAEQRPMLEATAGGPLTLSGVAAAAFADLGLTPEAGEMLHLLLRLPGAAAHALEQKAYGHKRFPFYAAEPTVADDGRGP